MSDSPELLKPDTEVTDSELQNKLGNLKAENEKLQTELGNVGNLKTENEKLRADYAAVLALLESSTVVTNKLRQEVRELRSQLATEKTRWDELREELDDREKICIELERKLADREKEPAAALAEVADLKQKSVAASKDFPEAADLLNQLKTRRKKSTASLADIETILEMIEKS